MRKPQVNQLESGKQMIVALIAQRQCCQTGNSNRYMTQYGLVTFSLILDPCTLASLKLLFFVFLFLNFSFYLNGKYEIKFFHMCLFVNMCFVLAASIHHFGIVADGPEGKTTASMYIHITQYTEHEQQQQQPE